MQGLKDQLDIGEKLKSMGMMPEKQVGMNSSSVPSEIYNLQEEEEDETEELVNYQDSVELPIVNEASESQSSLEPGDGAPRELESN